MIIDLKRSNNVRLGRHRSVRSVSIEISRAVAIDLRSRYFLGISICWRGHHQRLFRGGGIVGPRYQWIILKLAAAVVEIFRLNQHKARGVRRIGRIEKRERIEIPVVGGALGGGIQSPDLTMVHGVAGERAVPTNRKVGAVGANNRIPYLQ